MAKSLLALLLLGVFVTVASAFDGKELEPCKPAAVRYCEHADASATPSMTDLLRCGATLAAQSHRVSERCREVLRRYGQL
jgi:hypothetical protein